MESPTHQPKQKLHQPFLQFQMKRNFQFRQQPEKRPLSSAKSSIKAGSDNFIPYLDIFLLILKPFVHQLNNYPFWFLVLIIS
jgi:hypothetical protein